MKEIVVLLVFTMMNGQPSSSTRELIAMDPLCGSEMAAVEAINRARKAEGVELVAFCERRFAGS